MAEEWLATVTTDLANPEPFVFEESQLLNNDYLSPPKLKEISGNNDLNTVESIEIVINTNQAALGNFGQYLPSLTQLKLNDSVIPSIRDIGTSFSCLTVLWMSRCRTNEIDGIASMQSLQELYIAFNNISDLSPISFLENLEVLDLEANKVADIDQIDYLSIMGNLNTLTLTGNPICKSFSKPNQSFREYVLQRLPNLQQLDDIGSFETAPTLIQQPQSQHDIDIITNAIKVAADLENDLNALGVDPVLTAIDSTNTKNISLSLFAQNTQIIASERPKTAAVSKRRPGYFEESAAASTLNVRPDSSGSDNSMTISDDTSNLTFGNPLCGNLVQALKQRKKGVLPGCDFFGNEVEFLSSNFLSRPATSLGIRTCTKVGRSMFDGSRPFTSVPTCSFLNSKNENSSYSSMAVKELKSHQQTNGVQHFETPSHPIMVSHSI